MLQRIQRGQHRGGECKRLVDLRHWINDRVCSLPAGDHIGGTLTVDDIITVFADQGVDPRSAKELIVAVSTEDLIVPCAAIDGVIAVFAAE